MAVGSSPRARGTGAARSRHRRQGRFIPACAGNSLTYQTCRQPRAVHPRVRGEQLADTSGTLNTTGSSPRARGTVRISQNKVMPLRFIPACAGNRASEPPIQRPIAVHPRVRGEQRVPAGVIVPALRFIPACAGNRHGRRDNQRQAAVHPRVRGEQLEDGAHGREAVGSSPRARGTARIIPRLRAIGRFIPACAGNSWAHRDRTLQTAVHPRVRGEQSSLVLMLRTSDGSSPRARGTA